MQFGDYIWLEVIKTAFAFVLLSITWFLGQRILAYWELRKKRREFDIATTNQFYQLYGEFRAVQRLWRVLVEVNEQGEKRFPFPFKDREEVRLELLKRAIVAESGIEAVTIKLATERALEDEDIKCLGLLRQAFQILREAIRDDKPLSYRFDSPEYILFINLASNVARVISHDNRQELLAEFLESDLKQPDLSMAQHSLREITKYRSEDFKLAAEQIKLTVK